jgi:GTP:adenosylcobinamide-phosphate guanylyltransferase
LINSGFFNTGISKLEQDKLAELLHTPPYQRKLFYNNIINDGIIEMIKKKNIFIVRHLINNMNTINIVNMIKNIFESNEINVITDKGKGYYLNLNEILYQIQQSPSIIILIDITNNKDNLNELFEIPILLIELCHAINLKKHIIPIILIDNNEIGKELIKLLKNTKPHLKPNGMEMMKYLGIDIQTIIIHLTKIIRLKGIKTININKSEEEQKDKLMEVVKMINE